VSVDDIDPEIDWSLTTWEGSRKAQLRSALAMTVRERLEAMEGLADLSRRFQEMREQGRFKSPVAADGAWRGRFETEGEVSESEGEK